jgi:cellulose synthase (UDP-forming)
MTRTPLPDAPTRSAPPVPPVRAPDTAAAGRAADPRLQPPRWSARERPGRWRHAGLRALVVLNLGLAAFYFSWLLQPGRVGAVALFAALVAAELFNLVQAGGFWWTIWRSRGRARRAWSGGPPAVDVLVPVCGEPVHVVEPTVAHAAALTGARVTVHLLDDGGDPEMRALAARHGAAYVTRQRHTGAKAGNINHALAQTDGQFVLVLDCDHVPRADFLEATLGWLQDDDVAFVQTPQYYADAPSGGVAGAAWAQQALFFGAIARGKDGHGAMFCAGTNVVFRRRALTDVGGFPEDSLTEDFALSVHLHERGWRSAYVPEVLAQGLGPQDTASYVSQQQRWARGCLGGIGAVLRSRLPLRARAQYLLSAMFFLSGWTVLIYMSFPVVRILGGQQPLAGASADQFLIHFVPYFGASLLTVAVAGAGAYSFPAFALAAANFWIHIQATLTTLARRRGRFVVTPKEGQAGAQPRAVWPALLVLSVLLATVWRGLAADRSPATLNNVAFAGLHVTVLATGVAAALRPAPGPRVRRAARGGLAGAGAIASVAAVVTLLAVAFPEPRDGGRPAARPDAVAVAAGRHFLDRYQRPDGRVARTDQGGDTVSEGQAYAMLVAAGIGDRERFAAAWDWARRHLQRPDGLLSYRWQDGRVTGRDPATDADLDAARALLLAADRFDVARYRGEARRLGAAILAHETLRDRSRARSLAAGTWAVGPRTVNPSYAAPASFRALDQVTGSDRVWRGVAATERGALAALLRRGALPPDWATRSPAGVPTATHAPSHPETGPQYSFDALRVPLRLAESCNPADRNLAAAMWPALRMRPGASARRLDGRPLGRLEHPAAFAGAAAAAHAAGAPRTAAELLDRATAQDRVDPTYYGAAWVALGRLMLQTDRLAACGTG